MKKEVFSGYILMINEVIPTLEKEGIIYANLIKAEDSNGVKFNIYERNGLPIADYVGKPLECIIEMTSCEFYEMDIPREKIPEDVIEGEYMWSIKAYKFIPELVELLEGYKEDPESDFSEDEYEDRAESLFNSWGVTGCGLDIYQDKPMIKTTSGIILLNFESYEEIIDEWEYEEKIRFKYSKGILRGFKLFEGKWNPKPKLNKYGFEEVPGESYIVGQPMFIDNSEEDSIGKRVKEGIKKIFGD